LQSGFLVRSENTNAIEVDHCVKNDFINEIELNNIGK